MLLLLQASLFQHVVQCARRDVNSGIAGDCDRTGLSGMTKLSMASLRSNLQPAIGLDESNQIPNLHMSHHIMARTGLGITLVRTTNTPGLPSGPGRGAGAQPRALAATRSGITSVLGRLLRC
jgi:hypothetical protein